MVHGRSVLVLIGLVIGFAGLAIMVAGPWEGGGSGFQSGAVAALDDPALCATCHVMGPQFSSYIRSTHAGVATCNDCHVSHGVFAGPVSKVKAGVKHVTALLAGHIPDPIRVSAESRRLIQENCVRCHEPLVRDTAKGGGPDCLFCHRYVAHSRPYAKGR